MVFLKAVNSQCNQYLFDYLKIYYINVDIKKGWGDLMLIFIKTELKSNRGSCHVKGHFGFKKLFLFLIFRNGNEVVCDKTLIELVIELGLFVTVLS